MTQRSLKEMPSFRYGKVKNWEIVNLYEINFVKFTIEELSPHRTLFGMTRAPFESLEIEGKHNFIFHKDYPTSLKEHEQGLKRSAESIVIMTCMDYWNLGYLHRKSDIEKSRELFKSLGIEYDDKQIEP
jgi:hypothetical protein